MAESAAGGGLAQTPRNRKQYLGGLRPIDCRGVMESMRLQDQVTRNPGRAHKTAEKREARQLAVCHQHMGAGVNGRADARLRSMDPTEPARPGKSVGSCVERPRAWNQDRVAAGWPSGSGSTRTNASSPHQRLDARSVEKARPAKSAARRPHVGVDQTVLSPRQASAEQLMKKLSTVPDGLYDSDDPDYDSSQRTRDYRAAARVLTRRSERFKESAAVTYHAEVFAVAERELDERRKQKQESERGPLRDGKECQRSSGRGARYEEQTALQQEREARAFRLRQQASELLSRERDLEVFHMQSRGEIVDEATTMNIPGGAGNDNMGQNCGPHRIKTGDGEETRVAPLSGWFNWCTFAASKPWVNGDKAGASHTSLGTSHLAPAANCARESHGNCDDASDFVKSQSDLTAGTTGYQEAEAAEKKKNSAGTTSWIFTGSRPPAVAGQEIAISDSERRAQADTKEIGGVEGVQIGEDTWLTNVIGGSSEGGAFFNLSWWLGAGVTHCGRLKEEDRERERRRLSQRDYGKRARGVPRLDLSAESVRKPATREGVCASGHGQRGVVLTQEELERYNWIMDIGEPRTSGSEFTKSSGTQDAPSDGTPRARLAEARERARAELAARALENKGKEGDNGRTRPEPLKTSLPFFSQWRESVADPEACASASRSHPVHVVCTLHEFEDVDLENRLSARTARPDALLDINRVMVESRNLFSDYQSRSETGTEETRSEDTRSTSCHSQTDEGDVPSEAMCA